jgi:hypothetical protein
MNLVQIQENLKDLPTQAIMAYANGKNPEVPPYMALSELNRRKSMEQRAAQPPKQSVKDQLEASVSQPPQDMPPGMPQGGPQMPQGPQGIAQLPGAQGAPQGQGMPQMPEMHQGAPGMAAGGLAALPVPDDMFNYAPGGIVAFAGGRLVMGPGGELIEEDAGEDAAKSYMSDLTQGPPAPAPLSMDDLGKSILRKQMMGETNLPKVMSPAEARQEAIKQRPELAPILNSLPGGAITELITKLKERDQATQEKSKENEGRLGLAGLSNALIAAGEATRGHKGMALGEAFGGFGKSYGKYTEEAVKRSEAQQALQRQYEIETAKLQSDVQNLQRAYANNDVNAIAQHSKDVSDRQAKIDGLSASAAAHGLDIGIKEKTLQETMAQHQAQNTMSQAQLEELRRHHQGQEAEWKSAAANRAEQLSILKESKTPVENKKIDMAEKELSRDRTYQDEVKKLENYTTLQQMQSPDYLYHRAAINAMRKAAYLRQGLEAPEDFQMPNPETFVKPKEPRWWESSPKPKSPKPVSFSNLPE